jgi:hypothetical protein
MPRLPRFRLLALVLTAISIGGLIVKQSSDKNASAYIIDPVKRTGDASRMKRPSSAPASGALVLERKAMANSPANNLFAKTDWTPAPPAAAPVVAPPAPPPKAPPVPFSFVGLLENRAKPQAFLAKGSELLIVSAGDTLDAAYRVESLGAREIVLTYLPLKQQQTIVISGEL